MSDHGATPAIHGTGPGRFKRVAVPSILAVAVAGGAGAWAGGLISSSKPATQHSAVVITRHVPVAKQPVRATPKAVLAVSSPWRTAWALSLDHPGVTTGTNLSCRIVAHVALSGSQVRFRLVNYPSTTPVTFSHLVAAVRTFGLDVDAATQRVVTVHGSTTVMLPPNGDVHDRSGQPDGDARPGHHPQHFACGAAMPRRGTTGATRLPAARRQAPATPRPQRPGCPTTSAAKTAGCLRCRWFPPAPVPTVAVYGDSLTDGLFLPRGLRGPLDRSAAGADRRPARGAELRGRRRPHHRPGARRPGSPPRVATDVLAPRGVSAVIVEMGSNDIKAGVSASEILARSGCWQPRSPPGTRRSSWRPFRDAATG